MRQGTWSPNASAPPRSSRFHAGNWSPPAGRFCRLMTDLMIDIVL